MRPGGDYDSYASSFNKVLLKVPHTPLPPKPPTLEQRVRGLKDELELRREQYDERRLDPKVIARQKEHRSEKVALGAMTVAGLGLVAGGALVSGVVSAIGLVLGGMLLAGSALSARSVLNQPRELERELTAMKDSVKSVESELARAQKELEIELERRATTEAEARARREVSQLAAGIKKISSIVESATEILLPGVRLKKRAPGSQI